MAIYKEWMLPLARTLLNHGASGCVYALGDQDSTFTHKFALRSLTNAGLLRNPSAPFIPCHSNFKFASFRTFLGMLGFDEFYDIDFNGKAAITLDFSQPLPPHLLGKADIVIDVGTTEHIFNLPQAFTNIVHLLKVGGIVVHLNPVSWYNHGFVNFNPILFSEFYRANDFEILEHRLILQPLEYPIRTFMSLFKRDFRFANLNHSSPTFSLDDDRWIVKQVFNNIGLCGRTVMLFTARSRSARPVVRLPIQGIYQGSEKVG